MIAQQFAQAPSLDPSGTSWLPLPFWLTGSAFLLFGNAVGVAQALNVALSLASAASVWLAALWIGASRSQRLCAALLAAVLPHAVWLGAATVPEGFSAALCLLGAASLARSSSRVRGTGALCLAAATLCRYETWAIALVAAAWNGWDGWREQSKGLAGCALLCLAGALGWLVHGWVNHGDALFFVARVADYRRGIGAGTAELWPALGNYPLALLREEPHLTALALAVVLTPWREFSTGLLRLLGCTVGLLIFLVWGDLRDGAPTHHPERPLLFAWLAACVLVGFTLPRLWLMRRRLALAVLALAGVACVARPLITAREPFAQRGTARELGERAHELLASGEHLLIDTGDYGYFAVVAGFGDPARATGLVDSDPRQAQLAFADRRQRLAHHLRRTGASWLVTRADAKPAPAALGVVREQRGELVLVQLTQR